MGKFWRGKSWQIWRIMSYLPNFSLPLFTDTPKMYLVYALTVTYLPNFSSPIALTCMVCQNFLPPKFSCVRYLYLYLNISKSTCILLKYFSQNNTMCLYLYLYFTKYQSIIIITSTSDLQPSTAIANKLSGQ